MMGNATVDQAVVSTKLPRLDIVPATQDLSGAEVELVDVDQRMHRLDGALNAIPAGRYDVVLTDCPPSLGPLPVNALVAEPSILVPLQCDFFALAGLSQLLDRKS